MMAGARLNPGSMVAACWGLTYLVLVGAIGVEMDWGRQVRPALPAPKPLSAARADYTVQPEFTVLPLEQGLKETTARPIFSPSRRPSLSAVAAKFAMQKGQFALLGSLITREKKIAMLRDFSTGKVVRVEEGKEIRGIIVTGVYPEKVVLAQGDDTEELALKIQPPGRSQATAAPVQARPPQGQPKPPGQLVPPPRQAAGAPPNSMPGIAAPADEGEPPMGTRLPDGNIPVPTDMAGMRNR